MRKGYQNMNMNNDNDTSNISSTNKKYRYLISLAFQPGVNDGGGGAVEKVSLGMS